MVEDLGAHAQAVAEPGGPHGHDHELLEVDVVVGMGAAVEDVHHGYGEQSGIDAAQIAVERLSAGLGRGPGHGQRHRQQGVGAEGCLVGRPVQLQHLVVDLNLPAGVQALQRAGNAFVHVGHGLLHAFAQIAPGVAVPQLHGFVLTGGGPRRNGRGSGGSAFQNHRGLYRGVSPRVQNLPGLYLGNGCHEPLFRRMMVIRLVLSEFPGRLPAAF